MSKTKSKNMKTKILLFAACLSVLLFLAGCRTPCCGNYHRAQAGNDQNSATPKCVAANSIVVPPRAKLPFHLFRTDVYTANELLAGYDPNKPDDTYRLTLDWKCYTVMMDETTMQKRADLSEADVIYFRLHDLAIEQALDRYLHATSNKSGPKKVVGIMGGHSLPRTEKKSPNSTEDSTYMQVALLAQRLSSNGFTIATGGGPGLMEAGNLGAWFADRPESELRDAVRMLASVSNVPGSGTVNIGKWLKPAFDVMEKYPRTNHVTRTESVGVPTWFYGGEAPSPFASHIAKYFENSLREEHLLAIANSGVIFAEGGFGTVQEIFQNACQNSVHAYNTNTVRMVLFGTDYWNPGTNAMSGTNGLPAWPLLQQLGEKKHFSNSLRIMNEIDAITNFIINPRP
jgi:predicted Rossmann-fold nucleotide-binding protein